MISDEVTPFTLERPIEATLSESDPLNRDLNQRAASSAGERPLHTGKVTGSIPVPPTISTFIEIPLSRGMFALVDVRDAALCLHKWHAVSGGKTFYAARRMLGKVIYMHREIMGSPAADVDHRDHDGLNNRRSNLRILTHADNLLNRSVITSGTYFVKNCQQWRVIIRHGGRRLHVGFFATREAGEAAHAFVDSILRPGLTREVAPKNFDMLSLGPTMRRRLVEVVRERENKSRRAA